MASIRLAEMLVQQVLERRREPRFFACREVILAVAGKDPITGCVTDWSVSGFRVTHKTPLRRDQEVSVIMPDTTVATRVVWTAQTEDGFQSGLYITPSTNT